MFSALAHCSFVPRRIEDGDGVLFKQHSCQRIGLGFDWITGVALLSIGLCGTLIGLPPAAQYILLGVGAGYTFAVIFTTGAIIKNLICPNNFLFGNIENEDAN